MEQDTLIDDWPSATVSVVRVLRDQFYSQFMEGVMYSSCYIAIILRVPH